MYQKTIQKPVEVVGIGLHKGLPISMRLEPMDSDSGIIFMKSDTSESISLSADSVVETTMATVIGNDGYNISTIEHFLSTLYAFGIDNLRVIIDGGEMPIMDGSAIAFCMLLEEAGTRVLEKPKKIIVIKKKILVTDGKKYAQLEPSKIASFDFKINFPHPSIKEQSYSFILRKDNFIDQIARARTFGFAKDIQYLQSKNLAIGASLSNAIGLDKSRVLNSEGLRFDDEFVRHKILDAMGDMMVTGHKILGKYSSFAGSHKLNHLLTKEIFSDKENYDFVSGIELDDISYEEKYA